MQKTEKTMAELEIDQNVKFEWDKITEAGAQLVPLSGPGCGPTPRPEATRNPGPSSRAHCPLCAAFRNGGHPRSLPACLPA